MGSMVNMQPETKPSNKAFWIFISIGAVIVIAAIAIGLVFAGMGSDSADGDKDDSTSQGESNGISDAPPAITSVEASMEGETVSFSVTTEEYDSEKWFLEYELADQNRIVSEKGYERSNSFDIQTEVSDSAYFRLKVRLSDKELESAWSDGYTIKLEDVSGVTMLQPSEAYYATPWAKGEGGEENLRTALKVAYKAEPISDIQCLPLNTGTMTPTLLLPPIPSVSPSDAILSYVINSWDDATNEVSITYYWC